jgi:hypothetical protein
MMESDRESESHCSYCAEHAICDFCVKSLSEVGGDSETIAEVGGFSGEGWRPAADVGAFAELLS